MELGDCADGRTRIVPGRFLADRDRGAQAGEEIDIGLWKLADELTCVGGEALQVSALSLRVERVEGERAFSAARNTGEADQLVAW